MQSGTSGRYLSALPGAGEMGKEGDGGRRECRQREGRKKLFVDLVDQTAVIII